MRKKYHRALAQAVPYCSFVVREPSTVYSNPPNNFREEASQGVLLAGRCQNHFSSHTHTNPDPLLK